MPRPREVRAARCLVTGASSGPGPALAEAPAPDGARGVLTGRSADRLADVRRGLVAAGVPADRLAAVAADLTDPADRRRLFAAVADRFGALDVLVNAAGVGAYGRFESHPESALRRVFEVNVFAL